jgi:hypothetical protein
MGSWVVESIEHGGRIEGEVRNGRVTRVQYYNDKFSFLEAQALTVISGSTTAGIDALMGTSAQVPPVNTKAPVIFGALLSGKLCHAQMVFGRVSRRHR